MNRMCAYVFLAIVVVMPVTLAQAADSLEAGMSELAQQIVEQSKATDKHSIAVAAFPLGDGSLSVLSNYLVDELVLSLFSVPDSNLQIVERSQLETILGELNLGQSGMIDIQTTKELGKMHGVDALIIGSITTIGDRVRVIARMISTETGQVFSAASTTIPKTNTIESLMSQKITVSTLPSTKRGGGNARQGVASPSYTSVPKKELIVDLGALQVEVVRIQALEKDSAGRGRLIIYINFINATDKKIWAVPGYPQNQKIIASDELGNIFYLEKSTGMERWRRSGSLGGQGKYLMLQPNTPIMASFLLRSSNKIKSHGKSISLSADFMVVTDPEKEDFFYTTATFIDLSV